MKKLILGLSAAALLCGCASEKKYNRELDSFLDQPVGKVEAKFGKPSAAKAEALIMQDTPDLEAAAKIIDDSSRVITYTKVDQSYVPSEYYIYGNTFVPGQEVVYSPFTGDYDFYPFEQSFGYTVEYVCQTSFLVEDGIVRAWRWKGNNCVAY